MMNDERVATGYLLSSSLMERSDADQIIENFSWANMLLMMFYIHAGPMPKIETVADFKKAVSDFNDSIQALELPKPEGRKDEL